MGTGSFGRIGYRAATWIASAFAFSIVSLQPLQFANAQVGWPFLPEQRSLKVRDPAELTKFPVPAIPEPPTVKRPQGELPTEYFSLDEAIRVSLANSTVVRVLAGVSASTSGRTIYDAAITNTLIDREQARFDPTLRVNNGFSQIEQPQATFGPGGPPDVVIGGTTNENYNLDVGLGKQLVTGGALNFDVNSNPLRTRPGVFPLNPLTRNSVDLSVTQPLLQGGGYAANMAPVVLARIDTERSFFQLKDVAQENVRGVIEAYWSNVFARVDVWAREQQVEQAGEALRIAEGRLRAGTANIGDVAQARVTLANFRATLVTSEANLLQREAALRNILGLPPADAKRLIPITPPNSTAFDPDWKRILEVAEERRPDIVELKLIIEADQQSLILANNQNNPRLDAVGLYRWNGLEGQMANGMNVSSGPGQFTDWTMGVNFSVPLGLRQGRAGVRRQELLIARDRANLEQGVHNASHQLAIVLRNLSQFYEQYLVFHEARKAAEINLNAQLGRFRTNQALFLSVLLAITDWGNAVSGEANALTQYNVQLANLERQTGTILETHGVAFYEERFNSLGPIGRWRQVVCYPAATPPTPNSSVYPAMDVPAEGAFQLDDPIRHRRPLSPEEIERIPLPMIPPLEPLPRREGENDAVPGAVPRGVPDAVPGEPAPGPQQPAAPPAAGATRSPHPRRIPSTAPAAASPRRLPEIENRSKQKETVQLEPPSKVASKTEPSRVGQLPRSR